MNLKVLKARLGKFRQSLLVVYWLLMESIKLGSTIFSPPKICLRFCPLAKFVKTLHGFDLTSVTKSYCEIKIQYLSLQHKIFVPFHCWETSRANCIATLYADSSVALEHSAPSLLQTRPIHYLSSN